MAQSNKAERVGCLHSDSWFNPDALMFKFTVRALSLICLLLAGFVAYRVSITWPATQPTATISPETMAAIRENARNVFEEMNTIDPLTGKIKMQTLTEESDHAAKESNEKARIAHENLLAAKARLKVLTDKEEALQAEKERILSKYR